MKMNQQETIENDQVSFNKNQQKFKLSTANFF